MRNTGPARDVAAALLAVPPGQNTWAYAIGHWTKLKSGTVAGILDRFHKAGWIACDWESQPGGGRPPRRHWKVVDRDALAAYARW